MRALLEPLGIVLELRREHVVMTFPSLQEQADHMERNFGPIVTAKATLGDGWSTVRRDLDEFMSEINEADDGTVVTTNEYLEIVGRLAQ